MQCIHLEQQAIEIVLKGPFRRASTCVDADACVTCVVGVGRPGGGTPLRPEFHSVSHRLKFHSAASDHPIDPDSAAGRNLLIRLLPLREQRRIGMMLLLVFHIRHDFIYIPSADRERAITALPLERASPDATPR